MVAVGQAMDAGLRNRASIELDMQCRRGLIVKPVVQMDRDTLRKSRTEVTRCVQITGGPAALADEGCRNENDRAVLRLR